MPIGSAFARVLEEYAAATTHEFKDNPLAEFIRAELPSAIRAHITAPERFRFQGSAGRGQWSFSPWVAIMDILVTMSVQTGYYVVYLVREDLTGIYLSLNQGVTDVRQKYRSEAKEALRTKAVDYRAQLGTTPQRLPLKEIDLRPAESSNLAAFYECGNICATFYSVDAIPADEDLVADLLQVLEAYEVLSYNETLPLGDSSAEDDAVNNAHLEDYRKFRQHKRVERNARLSKAVKEKQGYVCKACGFNFAKAYPAIGQNYIEAHHLVPIAELKGKVVQLDPEKDFTVLCANCHRMIHRTENPADITLFQSYLVQN